MIFFLDGEQLNFFRILWINNKTIFVRDGNLLGFPSSVVEYLI